MRNAEDESLLRAYGGIEMALWDLNGTLQGRPSRALLGGFVRERIPYTEYFAPRMAARRRRGRARTGRAGSRSTGTAAELARRGADRSSEAAGELLTFCRHRRPRAGEIILPVEAIAQAAAAAAGLANRVSLALRQARRRRMTAAVNGSRRRAR
jgi:L-alanine-DL-glutamate epimerase-like enolase superfamily enzyme